MKKVLSMAFLLGIMMLATPKAEAVFIVNTGTPTEVGGGSTLANFAAVKVFLAGQFTTTQAWTINSVEGYMRSEPNTSGRPGNISLAIYGDNANSVDVSNLLFRQTFNVLRPSNGENDWFGVSGMNLNLGAGTYWAAFEPLNLEDYAGFMPRFAPGPLLSQTAFLVNDGAYTNSNDTTGWRIDATAQSTSSAPVPEPASMLLFGTGLVGAAIRKRLK